MARTRIDLDGALAVVTGAGSGIGRATSLALAGAGTRVVAVDIDADAAGKTAVACTELGPEAHARTCDVADADAVQALADDVRASWGAPDVLVNNAGVGISGRLTETSLDDWRWLRGINLDGVLHGCKAFGPAMLDEGHGHVVNMSSALGYTARGTEIAYCTSKAAVLALSQCLRADWRPHGVSVSAICPGVIDTPIIDRTRFLGDQAATAERIRKLFRRGHKPESVARAVLTAIRHDRVMVAAGWEAKLGWWAHRALPLAVQQLPARQAI